MDYFDIIKRALKVSWQHKALWVLGLFVASGGGSSASGYSSFSLAGGTGSSASGDPTLAFQELAGWVESNVAVLMVLASVLVVLGVAFFILSIAAQGGLVYLTNEAEENRDVPLRDGWRTGFHRWGRTFMIDLVIAVPIVVMIALFAGVFGASVLGFNGGGDAAAAGGFAGLFCGLPLLAIAMVVASVLLGVVQSLALRYGVLHDVSFGAALSRAWSDLMAKRGAFVFTLVMLLPGAAYSAVAGVLALLFAVPGVLLMVSGRVVSGGALFVLMALVMMVPGAAYGAFSSSAWTIFFRRMNGMERALEVREPAPVLGHLPPVPPAPEPPSNV